LKPLLTTFPAGDKWKGKTHQREGCNMKSTKKKRFTRFVVSLISVFFLFSTVSLYAAVPNKVASQSKSEAPKYGGVLKVSDVADPPSIGYPAKMIRGDANRQGGTAIETLFRYDVKGTLTPWLATGFKQDAKNKIITLTLRKGVKFHDDTDFNAEAVKWNLEQFIAAKAASTQNFESMTVVNDNTLQIKLAEWDSTALGNLAGTVGMMASPTACKKNGVDWASSHPVGTGPFQFVSWEKDKKTIFKKFPGYWQEGKPYLDGVEWTNITDPVTREMAFKGRELDVALFLDWSGLKNLESEGYIVNRMGLGGASTLVPSSTNPNSPWAKLKVRQAAQYAINSPELVKTVLNGEANPTNQWTYKGNPAYNPTVVGYPYNPSKAKQLLKEAGYPNGFKTKIMFRKGFYEQQIAAAQGYLQAVGIDAELDATMQARWDQTAMGGAWEGLIFGAGSGEPDVLTLLAVRMSGLANWYKATDFPADYKNAVKVAIAAPDLKTKQKRVWDIQKMMIDKYCIAIMLWSGLQPSTEHLYVKNTGFMKNINSGFWTPEDTWLAK
jgi:peptide/nickel transport system substrate-binding protein